MTIEEIAELLRRNGFAYPSGWNGAEEKRTLEDAFMFALVKGKIILYSFRKDGWSGNWVPHDHFHINDGSPKEYVIEILKQHGFLPPKPEPKVGMIVESHGGMEYKVISVREKEIVMIKHKCGLRMEVMWSDCEIVKE